MLLRFDTNGGHGVNEVNINQVYSVSVDSIRTEDTERTENGNKKTPKLRSITSKFVKREP